MKTKWRFRFYPTPSQVAALAQTFGCCRYVYNWGISLRSETYTATGKSVSFAELSRRLTILKKDPEHRWLNNVSAVPLQQSLRHLDQAYRNFFSKQGLHPKFKKKVGRQAATYVGNAFRYEPNARSLSVAKLGPLKVRWSRPVVVEPSSATVIRSASGRYFVTLTLDIPDPAPLPPSETVVGVDLGLTTLVTLSTGEKVENPRHLTKRAKRLVRAQRVLSRRRKGSGRYHRQRHKLARLHERVADARKDHLDKLSTRLLKEFGTVVLERLNVRGMAKNHKLARSMYDAALGTFRRMVERKAERMGRQVYLADPFFPSSKLCSDCGHRVSEMPLDVRSWRCAGCGTTHDRDVNAARNLAGLAGPAGGHPVAARGGGVSRRGASAAATQPPANREPLGACVPGIPGL